MTNSNPEISIIFPIYNENINYLEKSIISLLNQSFTNFECIFIDDSNDASPEYYCKKIIGKDSRFRYLKPKKRIGLPASLNLGISIAKSDLIARFDSDDLCEFDRLEKQLNYLKLHKKVDVLGSSITLIDEVGSVSGLKNYPSDHASISKFFLVRNAIAHPSVMFRKELISKYGGYDEAFLYAEDLELWLRLLNHGVQFHNLNYPLLRYRSTNRYMSHKNWIYNIKARLKNLGKKDILLKLIIIFMIFLLLYIPSRFINFFRNIKYI